MALLVFRLCFHFSCLLAQGDEKYSQVDRDSCIGFDIVSVLYQIYAHSQCLKIPFFKYNCDDRLKLFIYMSYWPFGEKYAIKNDVTLETCYLNGIEKLLSPFIMR